jgi:hypothetical protein
MAGMSPFSPGSNSIVPTAAVFPTLNTLAIPVFTPEAITAVATWSVIVMHIAVTLCVEGNLLLIAHV